MKDSISLKILAIALVGGICFVASVLVLALIEDRQNHFDEAKQEIANTWGNRQVVVGPMIISTNAEGVDTYLLPETLQYETVLLPEVRSRGIFKSIVYTSTVKVSGEFRGGDIERVLSQGNRMATFSISTTDTRGIEKQFDLTWSGNTYAFNPGSGASFIESSGLHAFVPIDSNLEKIPFSFELQLKGSEGISIAPLGKETILTVSSLWTSPQFVLAFLPFEISSFARSYPQLWQGHAIPPQQLVDSAAGVDLHEQIDAYDMVLRSVKYAILFIIITFAGFFLFDIFTKVRIHPLQYLLIGVALSLFYLLLLSLTEQIGFLPAYIIATAMIALLITTYSSFVLKSRGRAVSIFILLVLLYGCLYFVLQLEDYALLFGSLLLFVLLGVTMYLTRNINWFTLEKVKE